MIIAELITYLRAQSSVTDLCGTDIYPLRVPQYEKMEDHLPAITMGRTSTDREQDIDGVAGYVRTRIAVLFWGTNYDSVEALAEAVRNELENYEGTLNSIDVEEVTLDDESDDYEGADDGSDLGVFSIEVVYVIAYRQDVPTHS